MSPQQYQKRIFIHVTAWKYSRECRQLKNTQNTTQQTRKEWEANGNDLAKEALDDRQPGVLQQS